MTPTFIGNQLWLDFVDTEVGTDGERVDLLDSAKTFEDWMARAATVHGQPGSRAPMLTEGLLEGAVHLRAALRAIAENAAAGRPPPRDAVEQVNGVLRDCVSYPQAVPADEGFEWRHHPVGDRPLRYLGPIAISAAKFLVRGDPSRVKQCEEPRCVLYFYDTTKNRGRRFCSPETCGNRARAAAFYRRRTGR